MSFTRRLCLAPILLFPVGLPFVSAKPVPKPRTDLTRNFAVPVLMYHRIDDLDEREARSPLVRDLTVSPKDFEEQIQFLVKEGYSILSVYDVQRALLEGGELPRKSVAITMDDGYRDNFDEAFPILRKYGVGATVFLVSSTLDDARHLTWSQIHEMRRSNWTYGSHTMTHADLPTVSDDRLDEELAGSRQIFESKLGEPVTTLAYPAGRFDDRVVEHTRQAGYLTAWDKGGGPVRVGDDPFRLPRVRVHGRTTLRDFRRKVSSGVWAIRLGQLRI